MAPMFTLPKKKRKKISENIKRENEEDDRMCEGGRKGGRREGWREYLGQGGL